MSYTPEQLREWAHHTHAAWEAAGEAVILDVDFIAAQFRAHAAALEELAALRAALESANRAHEDVMRAVDECGSYKP